jgi:hypothetical protein
MSRYEAGDAGTFGKDIFERKNQVIQFNTIIKKNAFDSCESLRINESFLAKILQCVFLLLLFGGGWSR